MAIFVAGVFFALAASLRRNHALLDWPKLFGSAVCMAIVTQVSAAVVMTRRWKRTMLAIALVLCIVGAAALHTRVSQNLIVIQWLSDTGFPMLLSYFALFAAVHITFFVLTHWSKFGSGRSPWVRNSARGGLGAMVLFGLGPMFVVYGHMLRGPSAPDKLYGPPNSYPRVLEGARKTLSLNPSQSPVADINRTRPRVAKEIEDLYAGMMAAADTPGHVPLDWVRDAGFDYQVTQLRDVQILRNLARSWSAESQAAVGAQNLNEAIKYILPTVQAGSMLSRGGSIMHSLVGVAMEGIGIHDLIPIRNDISMSQARTLLSRLEKVDGMRESAEATMSRDAAWLEKTINWIQRFERAVAAVSGAEYIQPGSVQFKSILRLRDATLRLMMTELAIRLYQHDHGNLPDNLDELSPQYLFTPPADPYSTGSLIYRRQGDKYLLYSIGPDGQDNGGRFGTLSEIISTTGIDFDLETNTRPKRKP